MAEYIEREASVNLILETPFTMSMCLSEQECHGMNRAKQIIARLVEQSIPAANVRENVTGRWIWDDEGYHCSECLYHAYGNTGEVLAGQFLYCPWCGADMTGGNDG